LAERVVLMSDNYGVLLVSGRRTHQEGHAAAFDAHPSCELIAVTDEKDVPQVRAEANRLLAEDYSIPYIPDLDQALQLLNVDIVSACPDVERRGRVAVRCADAGKHLYLDKPLAGTIADARAIVDAVGRNGVSAQMFSQVHSSFAQRARSAIDSGLVGELKAVHIECVFAKGAPGTATSTGPRAEKSPPDQFTFVEAKREMFDLGVYAVALVRWLSGKTVSTVEAVTSNYFFAEHEQVGVEDFGIMNLGLEGVVSATIAAGRFGWTSHPGGGPLRIVLVGTNGVFEFDAYSPGFEIHTNEPGFTMPDRHPLDPMGMWASTQRESGVMRKNRWHSFNQDPPGQLADVSAFIDCIETGAEPEMNVHLAETLTEVILAGYESAAIGGPVGLPKTP
jgi:predicted dehydrogenase